MKPIAKNGEAPRATTEGDTGARAGALINAADKPFEHALIATQQDRQSTGVYDCGYREPFLPDPEKDIIPAIAFVEDTFEIYRDVVDQTIEIGKAYGRRKGIIE